MITKKLMLNDFEIIIWMIWLRIVQLPDKQEELLDYLNILALFVKQDNNDQELYKVFDTFYSHNYPHFYAKYKTSHKPLIVLTSTIINEYYKELTKTFEYKKELKDYNFEVDALETEHEKREVHTTLKFEEERWEKMKEEAQRENSRLSNGKTKVIIKVDKKEEISTFGKRRVKKDFDKIKDGSKEAI